MQQPSDWKGHVTVWEVSQLGWGILEPFVHDARAERMTCGWAGEGKAQSTDTQ